MATTFGIRMKGIKISEEEWNRRRTIAKKCKTWSELKQKLNVPVDSSHFKKHGIDFTLTHPPWTSLRKKRHEVLMKTKSDEEYIKLKAQILACDISHHAEIEANCFYKEIDTYIRESFPQITQWSIQDVINYDKYYTCFQLEVRIDYPDSPSIYDVYYLPVDRNILDKYQKMLLLLKSSNDNNNPFTDPVFIEKILNYKE